jgi:hypothetical protein
MSTALDDEIDDEAPTRPPTRRDGRVIAVPNAPIPTEVNDAFLDDLAFERALSAARGLSWSTSPVAAFRRSGGAMTSPTPPRPSRPPVLSSHLTPTEGQPHERSPNDRSKLPRSPDLQHERPTGATLKE